MVFILAFLFGVVFCWKINFASLVGFWLEWSGGRFGFRGCDLLFLFRFLWVVGVVWAGVDVIGREFVFLFCFLFRLF